MKTIPALFCGLMLGMLPAVLHAQQQTGFKIDKITPTFIDTPQYQVSNPAHQPQSGPGSKWLEIEVQFEAAADTDELTVKYYVMLNQVILSGEVTHLNVTKGQELYSVMYVTPQEVAKLMAGKPATASAVKDVGIELAVQGQVVARMSTKAGYAEQWWTLGKQTSGLLLNKNQTPFAPLYWDRYPQIKSDH